MYGVLGPVVSLYLLYGRACGYVALSYGPLVCWSNTHCSTTTCVVQCPSEPQLSPAAFCLCTCNLELVGLQPVRRATCEKSAVVLDVLHPSAEVGPILSPSCHLLRVPGTSTSTTTGSTRWSISCVSRYVWYKVVQ